MKITLTKFELPIMGDEKYELVEKRFGMIGFAVIVKLFARIYGTNGYFCRWDNSFIDILARSLDVEPRTLSDVVAYAVSVGFFDGDLLAKYSILTSADIQEQYFRSVSRRAGVTYDPDYVIGDFYLACRRAAPFKSQRTSDVPATEIKAVTEITAEKAVKEVTAVTAETAVKEVTAETAEKETSAFAEEELDPIVEMQCRHMFAKGKTVPLARLVEMTGANTLVESDGIPEVTAAEVCTPEEAMSAMLDDGFVDVGSAVDAFVGAMDATVSDGEREPTVKDGDSFLRDHTRPRRDKVYGRFFNVLLDDDEYNDLASRIPNVDDYIQRLSRRLLDKDFRCESAYRAIIDCHEMAASRSGVVA